MHMDEEVIRNDRTYVSTSLAAELSGYSRDYIGQLARDGYVDSTKVGRKRFVDRGEFIAYALENKSGLTVDDLPDNHVPDDLVSDEVSDTPDQKDRTSRPIANQIDDQTRNSSPEDTPNDSSIVIDPSVVATNSFQTQPDTETNRVSSRWRKHRDQKQDKPKLESGKRSVAGRLQSAVMSIALIAAASIGVVFASSPSIQKAAHQTAASVVVTAERAYEGIGFGLHQKLSSQSAPEAIAGSVVETTEMLTDYTESFSSRLSARLAESPAQNQLNQTAAAQAAQTVTASLDFLGEEIARQFSWLSNAGSTEPMATSDGNYFVQTRRLAQDTPAREQISQYRTQSDQLRDSQIEAAQQDSRAGSRGDAVDRPRKAVVVPAPTTTKARKRTKEKIREQFSDPVAIATSSANSGVIQPQFEDRAGDEYLYIMVPNNSP
jgi:hypothetical protein